MQVDSALQPHLRFWSGRKICELLDSFLPFPTAPDYLAAFHHQASALEHFDVSATVDALGVRYAVAARQDGALFAQGVLSFPETPEGDAVLAALDRHIESGEPVTVPASFVESFLLHPELEGLLGPGGPADLVLGGSDPDPHATVSVEVDGRLGPLQVRGLTVVSARMGTRRGELRTDPKAHPFALSLQIERVEGGIEITTGVQVDPAGCRVRDALQALRVWDAIGSGSPIRLILDATGDTLVELDASAHAHEPHTLAPYLENLAALEGFLGEIEVPETLTQTDLQNAALLRSILTTGVGTRPFDGLTLTYAPGDEDTDALLRILSDEPHWMRETRAAPRFELVGHDLPLGPAHALFQVRLDPVEADRVRARLAAGDAQASIRFDAAGERQRTTVYRDHLPEPLRSRYEELRERMPPLLDWSPDARSGERSTLSRSERQRDRRSTRTTARTLYCGRRQREAPCPGRGAAASGAALFYAASPSAGPYAQPLRVRPRALRQRTGRPRRRSRRRPPDDGGGWPSFRDRPPPVRKDVDPPRRR